MVLFSPTNEIINTGKIIKNSCEFLDQQSTTGQLRLALLSLATTSHLLREDLLPRKDREQFLQRGQDLKDKLDALLEKSSDNVMTWGVRTWKTHMVNRKIKALAIKVELKSQSAKVAREFEGTAHELEIKTNREGVIEKIKVSESAKPVINQLELQDFASLADVIASFIESNSKPADPSIKRPSPSAHPANGVAIVEEEELVISVEPTDSSSDTTHSDGTDSENEPDADI
ncbi:hypothetical protein DFH09DRAFT_1176392 [Mycena vulgaris]|nr:hypothetical protein DFH09DRAFT_1176392 [Mycena vulgaris]